MMSETKKSLHDFYETKVKDVMETIHTAPCVEENTPVENAFSLLKDHGYVWVIARGDPKDIQGVITESDMIAVLSPPVTSLQTFDQPDFRSLQFGIPLTAKEIMSKKPVTAFPDESIRDIIVKMKQFRVKQLPVVDHHEVFLGDVTLHQLIDRYCSETL